jgi:type II secretory pathway component PulF
MGVYQWSGKTPKGLIESGEITASTKEDVIAILGKRRIVPTLITEG